MATTFSTVQQLGGWEYDSYQRAVACRMLVDDNNDYIPIAALGLRRVNAMYVYSSDVNATTPRLLGRGDLQSPYSEGAENCYTLIGDPDEPRIRIYNDGSPVSNVGETIDVIFVGEV